MIQLDIESFSMNEAPDENSTADVNQPQKHRMMKKVQDIQVYLAMLSVFALQEET